MPFVEASGVPWQDPEKAWNDHATPEEVAVSASGRCTPIVVSGRRLRRQGKWDCTLLGLWSRLSVDFVMGQPSPVRDSLVYRAEARSQTGKALKDSEIPFPCAQVSDQTPELLRARPTRRILRRI
jgi:hypothetical protein